MSELGAPTMPLKPNVIGPEGRDLLERIKRDTRKAHDRIERVGLLSQIFEPDYDIYAYTKLLSAQYGFYVPAEARIRTLQHSASSFDSVSSPSKALLIRDDLMALGITRRELDALPISYSTIARDRITALGVSYVFEGATLGGKVISKRLEHVLGAEVSEANRFYGCYGKHCASHWAEFQEELIGVIGDDEDRFDQFIGAALETFESMTRWLENYE